MPHVVIKGSFEAASFLDAYEPVLEREGKTVLKTERAFIDKEQKTVLLEARAIEGANTIPFFAVVDTRDDGAVVRLHPSMDVEKTDGVKRILAAIAERAMKIEPGLSVGETNLSEFLSGAEA